MVSKSIIQDLLGSFIEIGFLPGVMIALAMGADVNEITSDDKTPLLIAVEEGKTGIVKYLVKHGANIDTQDCIVSPLLVALEEEHFKIVKYLVEKGADVNKCCPLPLAISSGQNDIAKLMVLKGADVNCSVNEKVSLVYALRNNDLELAEFLIAHGADVNLVVNGKPPIIQLLDVYDKFPSHLVEYLDISQIYEDFLYGNCCLEGVKFLVENGAKINVRDEYTGETPLHVAINYKNTSVVKYLIDAGADVNVKDSRGKTPLHYAVSHCLSDIVAYLLEKGANPDEPDKNGSTPALDAITSGCKEVIKTFLAHGIKIFGKSFRESPDNLSHPPRFALKLIQIARYLLDKEYYPEETFFRPMYSRILLEEARKIFIDHYGLDSKEVQEVNKLIFKAHEIRDKILQKKLM